MKSEEPVSSADAFRSPSDVGAPDQRTQLSLNAHHERVAGFVLHATVPHGVRVQFETAKNLWLYAWCVYRFYPVAERHALSTLEFALRERLRAADARGETRSKRWRGLRELLDAAIAQGLIRAEGLRAGERMVTKRAEHRLAMERFAFMQQHGLSELSYEDEPVVPTPEDRDFDLLDVLQRTLPVIRNDYAHGSTTLHPQMMMTFEVVSDLVNQLYEPTA